MMLQKKVGNVEICVRSNGWPIWTEVTFPHGGNRFVLRGLDELRDLQYAVDSAIKFVEAEEQEHDLRKRREVHMNPVHSLYTGGI